jgi:nucleoside triphosphate pyrophosphatase
MQSDYPEIILASASGARAAILASAGIRFHQQASLLDEAEERKHFASGTPPIEVAATLARLKAEMVLEMAPDSIVIGADQVLSLGDQILHKPGTKEEAKRQLLELRGRTHILHTSAVVLHRGGVVSIADSATLTVREFSDEFLTWYLETAGNAVLTSVGAYHIEGLGIHLFSEVKGDYYTILGLPIVPVLQELRRLSVLLT